MKKIFQIQIVRNLFGAVIGAGIALALYGIYQFGAGTVAYLIPPGGTTRSADAGEVQFASNDVPLDSEKFKRTAARARAIAESIKAAENKQHSSDSFISTYDIGSVASKSAASAMAVTHNVAAFPNAEAPHGIRMAASSQHSRPIPAVALAVRAAAPTRVVRSSAMRQQASSASVAAVHDAAPKLPSSGPVEWIALFVAFALAVPLNKKIQDRLLWSKEEEKVH